ncbi:relaxase/mobilization nuclease domain-containing protein [Streptomyces sp. NPDC048269]|uniref:relaxase/mobilization nuclease domain-containing protein n=1 Tax=Streptomyces sp. NPDC048269 TaxID=3155753 RepID=UPI00342CBC64
MITNIGKAGANTHGVLRYFYEPGRANEHTDPHLVASWDGFAPDPGREENATLAQLATVLDLRVKQAGDRAPAKHVWHCSVRTAPEDPVLTDEQWATVARRILNATGIAPAGDPDACRWVAVRYAEDHIHIVATKVRGDLTPPRHWNDYLRADKECAAIEKEYGLRQVVRGDRTAAKRPTRAEQEKALRAGHTATPRERLRTTVRTTVAAATGTEEFFTILRSAGVLVDIQRFPSGDIRGYKVALPGDTNAKGEPVWFSGSTLGPDLSYPKISERLAPTEPDPIGQHSVRRRTAWQQVTDAADRIPDVLDEADDAVGQAHITVLAETLDALPPSPPPATGPSWPRQPRPSSGPAAPASAPATTRPRPHAGPSRRSCGNPHPRTAPSSRPSSTPSSWPSSRPSSGTTPASTTSRPKPLAGQPNTCTPPTRPPPSSPWP